MIPGPDELWRLESPAGLAPRVPEASMTGCECGIY